MGLLKGARRNGVFQKNYVRIVVRKLLGTGLVLARAWGGQAVSRSNACCFDASFVQQFVAIGAEQAVQQALRGESSKRFEVPDQSAPVTLVPRGPSGKEQSTAGKEEEWDEEQRMSANRVFWAPALVERMRNGGRFNV